MPFERLVRFEHDGQIFYGDLVDQTETGFKVKKLQGNIEDGFQSTTEELISVESVHLDFKPGL